MTVRADIIDHLVETTPMDKPTVEHIVDEVFKSTKNARDLLRHAQQIINDAYASNRDPFTVTKEFINLKTQQSCI